MGLIRLISSEIRHAARKKAIEKERRKRQIKIAKEEARIKDKAQREQKATKKDGGVFLSESLLRIEHMNYTVVEQRLKKAGFTSVHSTGISVSLLRGLLTSPSQGTVKRILVKNGTPIPNKFYKKSTPITIEYYIYT